MIEIIKQYQTYQNQINNYKKEIQKNKRYQFPPLPKQKQELSELSNLNNKTHISKTIDNYQTISNNIKTYQNYQTTSQI